MMRDVWKVDHTTEKTLDQLRFVGNGPPTPTLSQNSYLLLT